jgi:hypothetical protein
VGSHAGGVCDVGVAYYHGGVEEDGEVMELCSVVSLPHSRFASSSCSCCAQGPSLSGR